MTRIRSLPFKVYGRTFTATAIFGVDSASHASVSGLHSGRLLPDPGWAQSTEEEWTAWRKAESAYARPVVEAALVIFGIEATGIAYSARRLCGCGCSGAYILAGVPRGVGVDVDEIVARA